MARLLLVRHGVTDHNSSHKFLGHTDVELSEEGVRQVEKLRDRLASEKFDAIYSSDLKRAMSTAEVVCRGHEAEIVPCPELREINYGDCESLTYGEIGKKYPELGEAISKLSPELAFPGGESLAGFIQRTLTFLDRIKEPHGAGRENVANGSAPISHRDIRANHRILIVSHGGAMRTLLCELLGVDQSLWRTFRVDNASLSIVDTYPRQTILSLLNDTSHLEKGPSEGE